MKATYQKPATDTMSISVAQIMTGSNNYGTPEAGQDLGTAQETDATSGNLSRRRNTVWDDEEEDEEY